MLIIKFNKSLICIFFFREWLYWFKTCIIICFLTNCMCNIITFSSQFVLSLFSSIFMIVLIYLEFNILLYLSFSIIHWSQIWLLTTQHLTCWFYLSSIPFLTCFKPFHAQLYGNRKIKVALLENKQTIQQYLLNKNIHIYDFIYIRSKKI